MPRAKPAAEKALDAVLRGLDIVPAEQRHDVLAHAKRILDRERKRSARAEAAVEPEAPAPDAQRALDDLNGGAPTRSADATETPT